MTKRENAIIFVDSNRILFYTKKATNVLELKLPMDVLVDLEVVNREKLEHLIDNVFTLPEFKNKEFEATIIFSSKSTFEKEIEGANSKEEFEETQKFLDMVPFEDMLSNSYRLNKKTKVVAVNKILYNILKQILEKNRAYALLVLPMTVLASVNPDLKSKIDFAYLEGKLESFKQYSIINLEEIGLGGEVTNSIGIKKKDVRLYVLIAVMAGLFLVLIFMIYSTFLSSPQPVKRNVAIPKSTTSALQKTAGEVENASESSEISTPSSTLNQ